MTWSSRQRLFALCAFVLLVVAAGLGIFFAAQNDDAQKTAVDQSLDTASELTSSGDYSQALQTLKAAQQNATTSEVKIRVLNDLAAAAANAGRLQEALEYYQQKHQLDPASKNSDGYLVGELHERLGDTAKAIESFQAYLEYLKSLTAEDFITAKIESLTERIKAMQGDQE